MIVDQVKKTIDTHRMLSRGDQVIVGVSGGMDSVALLSLLHGLRATYRIALVVAHLNHGLRGEESYRDERFVRDLALRLGLPCEVGSVKVKQLQKRGMTLQEAAREARFDFFGALALKHGAQKIALGHNADDQAETIVMRFLRGAGPAGLKGILPVRDEIIHPLIEVTREEIAAYLRAVGLTYVEDSSNLKDMYLRNRIRRHLIPILENYNRNLKTSLGRMGQLLRVEDEYIEKKVQEIWGRISSQSGHVVALDLAELRGLHRALQFRLLRYAIEAVGGRQAKELGANHVSSLVDLAVQGKPNAWICLPGRVVARRIYDRLEVGKGARPRSPFFDRPVSLPGITSIDEIGQRLLAEFVENWDLLEASSTRAFLDSHHMGPPLRVRSYRPGDRFRPLGMAGTKKIKDCFIDWKVPAEERARIPLVVSGDDIVWVVGYQINHDYRVTGETARVVRMEVQDL